MSDIVIRAENLSKQYRLGEIGTGTLSHDLNRWIARIRGKEDPYAKVGNVIERTQRGEKREYVWALKDINFEVFQGEVLGIIGKNGAGKSTLLKILSRITSPTSGEVKINGRVGSILEVGTGFHHEMTGRENIYMNGTILGMTRREISSKLDDIVDFAGVAKYIDTPVKRYSSGMMVGLGFAVAAFLEPEILIVDEVLAVGDYEFQKKAIGKMKEVSSEGGRTVLFVSHNMQSIITLTEKCLYLKNGMKTKLGTTAEVIQYYLKENETDRIEYENTSGLSKCYIKKVWLKTSNPNNIQVHGDSLEIHITLNVIQKLVEAGVAVQIINNLGICILNLSIFNSQQDFGNETGEYNLDCRIPKCRLFMGHYYLTLHFANRSGKEKLETIENICPFEVIMGNQIRPYPWQKNEAIYLDENEWSISMTKK